MGQPAKQNLMLVPQRGMLTTPSVASRGASSMARALVTLLVPAALLGSACGVGVDGAEVELSEEQAFDYEAVWERYRASARPGPNGGLVVEGDMYFASEHDLRLYFDELVLSDADKAHAFQRNSTGFIPSYTRPTSLSIRYCVSNAFGTQKATWVTNMAEATRAWERMANVRFTYVSAQDASCTGANNNVEFAVIKSDGIGGYFGCNKMLWSPLICPNGTNGVIEVDTLMDVTFGGAAPNVTTTGTLRHELGHILGLRHEHPWRPVIDPSCNEQPTSAGSDLTGVQLGNLAYDQNSVMHYPFNGMVLGQNVLCGGNPQSSFAITFADSHSVQRLYGMQAGWLAVIQGT